MGSLLDSIKYKYELVSNAILTGNYTPLLQEIKTHLYANKNIYTVLTFIVILYVIYEDDIYGTTYQSKNIKQKGGQTPPEEPKPPEAPEKTPKEANVKDKGDNNIQNNTTKGKKGKKGDNNSAGSSSASGSMPSGLCDGDNIISKTCKGIKDGVGTYFKFFGYIILAGLIVVSPFVIYVILVYMVLRIMFKGAKGL